MPFAPKDTLPQQDPDVRVYFTGLMILEPTGDDDKACQIFVNSSATRHYLTIEVRRKTANRPDEIMMRHVGPLAFFDPAGNPQIPLHGFHIIKDNAASTGVFRYKGSTGPKGEEDFNLAVDLARAPYHDTDRQVPPDLSTPNIQRNLLDIDNLVGRPSIFLNDGILHTAAKTHPKLKITLRHPQKPDEVLNPFANVIGANLYLNEGEIVRLNWRNQGKDAELVLQKPDPVNEPDTSYEIYIVNDPLFESSQVTDLKLDPKHDEFAEYYKLLSAVPTSEQFRLHIDPPAQGEPPPSRGSTHIPCMPITKGGD